MRRGSCIQFLYLQFLLGSWPCDLAKTPPTSNMKNNVRLFPTLHISIWLMFNVKCPTYNWLFSCFFNFLYLVITEPSIGTWSYMLSCVVPFVNCHDYWFSRAHSYLPMILLTSLELLTINDRMLYQCKIWRNLAMLVSSIYMANCFFRSWLAYHAGLLLKKQFTVSRWDSQSYSHYSGTSLLRHHNISPHNDEWYMVSKPIILLWR